jgi:ankyrin repeat protein
MRHDVIIFLAFDPGNYEIVEELLSRGACADPMWECKSPLYIAAQRGHTRMMELLLRHGAEVTISFLPALIWSSYQCTMYQVQHPIHDKLTKN